MYLSRCFLFYALNFETCEDGTAKASGIQRYLSKHGISTCPKRPLPALCDGPCPRWEHADCDGKSVAANRLGLAGENLINSDVGVYLIILLADDFAMLA